MGKIPAGTLILVADGGKARLLRNVGSQREISLRQEQLIEPVDLEDDGPSGRMPQGSSGYAIDEATFAKQLANRLNAAALKNEFAHLVLVADPQTLGHIRPQLHQETRDRLVGELAKTLTNTPIEEIEAALTAEG
jgi:protein required for attachment to host cells